MLPNVIEKSSIFTCHSEWKVSTITDRNLGDWESGNQTKAYSSLNSLVITLRRRTKGRPSSRAKPSLAFTFMCLLLIVFYPCFNRPSATWPKHDRNLHAIGHGGYRESHKDHRKKIIFSVSHCTSITFSLCYDLNTKVIN